MKRMAALTLTCVTVALAAPTSAHFAQLVKEFGLEGGLKVTTLTRAPAPLQALIASERATMESAKKAGTIKNYIFRCERFDVYTWSDNRYGAPNSLEKTFTTNTLAVMNRLKLNELYVSFINNTENAQGIAYSVGSSLFKNVTILLYVNKTLKTPNATLCEYSTER